MTIPSKTASSMQSLFETEFNHRQISESCKRCSNKLEKKRQIVKHSQYLIVKCQDGNKVGVKDGPNKPLNLTNIVRGNVKYWLVGAVLYANDHFTSLVKKKNGKKHDLYFVNEERVTLLKRWPNASKMKIGDVVYVPYLLIYNKDMAYSERTKL